MRRAQLEEAAAVSLEVVAVLDARRDFAAADQARVNRLETLLVLETALHNDRLRAAVRSDVPVSPSDLASLLDSHPAEALRLPRRRGTRDRPDSLPPLPATGDAPFAGPYFWAGFIAYGR